MGGGCTDNVLTMAMCQTPTDRIRRKRRSPCAARVWLGDFALASAATAGARAVVAICPAPAAWLRRALAAERLPFDLDAVALDAFFAARDLREVVATLDAPLLLLHTDGDQVVPAESLRFIGQFV